MEAAEPASGGVHDTKWTDAEIAEWWQKVAQVVQVNPRYRPHVSVEGVYDRRGAPEPMDLLTARSLARLVTEVEQWGDRLK